MSEYEKLTPPTLIPIPSTVVNEYRFIYCPEVEKLCPFCKRVDYYYESGYHVYGHNAAYSKESFLPCIKEKCMLYSDDKCTMSRRK